MFLVVGHRVRVHSVGIFGHCSSYIFHKSLSFLDYHLATQSFSSLYRVHTTHITDVTKTVHLSISCPSLPSLMKDTLRFLKFSIGGSNLSLDWREHSTLFQLRTTASDLEVKLQVLHNPVPFADLHPQCTMLPPPVW